MSLFASVSMPGDSTVTAPQEPVTTKTEVTIDVFNGLVKRQTKVLMKKEKRKGHKISEEEATMRVTANAHNRFSIMSETTVRERKQEVYEELKAINKRCGTNYSDKKLRKAAEKWDPSEVPSLYKEMAGLKKHTAESVLKKLTGIRYF